MKYPVVGLARALALWGTPSHDAGRRARSPGAPREGEGRRREGGVERSERYLDGRGTMGKRAEVEHPPQAASRLSLDSCKSRRAARLSRTAESIASIR